MTKGETASEPGTNGYDKKTVYSYGARLDALDEELESERGKYMKRCRELREEIGSVLDEAKAKGIPKKSFKAVRKAARYQRKAERARDDLEPDEQDSFDAIAIALGADFASFGLGKATLDGHAAKNQTVDSLSR
jgi:hypothetical protein